MSPSMVVALIALMIALGGTSYAAVTLPRNSVGATQLRTGAVRSAEVRDRSLRATDLSVAARRFLRGQRGPAGPQGPPGAAGTGGGAGAFTLTYVTAPGTAPAEGATGATATCPAGRRVTGGGASVDSGTDVSVRESYPSANNTAWTVRVGNDDLTGTATYTVFAICAAG